MSVLSCNIHPGADSKPSGARTAEELRYSSIASSVSPSKMRACAAYKSAYAAR